MNIWEKALEFEKEGRDFYEKKASENKGNSLYVVFNMLAEDEKRHLMLIENFMSHSDMELPEHDFPASMDSLFSGDNKDISLVYTQSEQLAIYHLARDIEKKGIDLYTEMYKNSNTDKEKLVISYLRGQEEKHYEIFDELVKRVGRPEEWVESAEFGEREEY